MDEMRYEAMARRIAALEARIVVLEEKLSAPQTQGGGSRPDSQSIPDCHDKDGRGEIAGRDQGDDILHDQGRAAGRERLEKGDHEERD